MICACQDDRCGNWRRQELGDYLRALIRRFAWSVDRFGKSRPYPAVVIDPSEAQMTEWQTLEYIMGVVGGQFTCGHPIEESTEIRPRLDRRVGCGTGIAVAWSGTAGGAH
jgi:hypothetical protein